MLLLVLVLLVLLLLPVLANQLSQTSTVDSANGQFGSVSLQVLLLKEFSNCIAST